MNQPPFMGTQVMQAMEAAGSPVSLTWLAERLASDNAALRIGAVHTLERVARDAAEVHWPIMEFFCDFLQEHAAWRGQEMPPAIEANVTLQAMLDVLGRRTRAHEYGKELRLNLTSLDLRGANLVGAHLERCVLTGTHLERAALGACHLEYALCEKVAFDDVWMARASLLGATLQGASLRGASLGKTIFSGANLQDVRLEGVDLSDTRGLIPAQVARAHADKKTKWPTSFDTEATQPGAR
jgi:hypothetical protein